MVRADEHGDWLAARFEGHRAHLRAVAFRMLGSAAEAEDAVQEAWLRLGRSGDEGIANLGGWLTTVVGRVCLDMLRARSSRRELPLADDGAGPEPVAEAVRGTDPEREAILADAVGAALLVVLETLTPAERLAFVLHDLFAVPFDQIALILDRSPAATRQLASRARRRVRGTDQAGAPDASGSTAQRPLTETEATGQRAIVDAFLAAAREGRFEALLALLAPDVVLRADPVAVTSAAGRAAYGAPSLSAELRGAATVAETFSGRAQAAQPALIDGVPGAVWAPGGQTRAAFRLTVADGTITAIDVTADPASLAGMDITILTD